MQNPGYTLSKKGGDYYLSLHGEGGQNKIMEVSEDFANLLA